MPDSNEATHIPHSASPEFADPLSLPDEEPAIFSPQTYSAYVNTSDDVNETINDAISNNNTLPTIPTYNITVSDPRKETEQSSVFISYLVTTNKNQVRRRFQDFAWLHHILCTQYSACFVPPLPDKHLLGYVKGDRFSSEFTEKRRVCLERFLQRIVNHPILSKSSSLSIFLESSDFNDASARASRENVIDTISDSLLNVFSKIKAPDPRFTDMKERNDVMESQLDVLQKTLLRTNKRTKDLYQDYKELSQSACTLSALDGSYKALMDDFVTALDGYTVNMHRASIEDTKWQLGIYDYMAYCRSIKDVLKSRDQKQLDFEELSEYLKSSTAERHDTLYGRLGEGGIVAYITEKLLELTGSNPNRIRRAKIERLDEQIRELEEAVKQTRQISADFSDQVVKENSLFNEVKNKELSGALKSYACAQVDFYQDGLAIWEDLLEKLEKETP